MANNYLQFSAILDVGKENVEKAREIVLETIKEHGEEFGDFYDEEFPNEVNGTTIEVEDDGGVWFKSEEYGNPEAAEIVARALIDAFEIDEPFILSWAYTCSKLRPDEFGGGAFVIKRGQDTYFVDAAIHVRDFIER